MEQTTILIKIYDLIDNSIYKKEIINELLNKYSIDKTEIKLNYEEFKELIKNKYEDKSHRFTLKKFYIDYINCVDYNTFKNMLIKDKIIIVYSDKVHYKIKDIEKLYNKYFLY